MKLSRKSILLLVTLVSITILTGCQSIPFKETELVPLNVKQPETVAAEFDKKTPEQFTLLNSIVFKYFWHSFSSMGVCKVDLEKDNIDVVGINQLGVKLFDLSGKPGSVKCKFAIKEFKKHKKFPETVITDIHNIYFNSFPVSDSEVIPGKYKICFKVPYKKGELFYYYGGKNLYLLEKKFIEEGDELWKVSFYEYTAINGKVFPKGIIYDNTKYGYQIIVRLKSVEN